MARLIKITFLSAYQNPYHYCTISQIIVNGKTYSSYAADQTKKFMTQELVQNINREFEEDQKIIEEVFERQHEAGADLISNMKSQFRQYLSEKERKQQKINYLNEKTTCLKFQDLMMFAKQ